MRKPPALGSAVYNGVQDVILLCVAESHLNTAHFWLEISYEVSLLSFLNAKTPRQEGGVEV